MVHSLQKSLLYLALFYLWDTAPSQVITLVMISLTIDISRMQLVIQRELMDMRWQSTLGRWVVWCAAEIILSMLGVDDLADYSEFLLEKKPPVLISQAFLMK